MSEHAGEDAELYALGMLDDVTARRLEAHLAQCDACRTRVAQAHLAAASLAAALPAREPSPELGRRIAESARAGAPVPAPAATKRPNAAYALAAAFALALGGLGLQTYALHERLSARDAALVTLIHGHFRHVTMTNVTGSPIAAKVLYAPDGSWLYLIAESTDPHLHAIALAADGALDLGALNSDGATASLLAHPKRRVRELEVQRDGVTLARATLVY